MMFVVELLIFAGATALAGFTLWTTVAPRLDRIRDALAGRPAHGFAPLAGLVHAERRIAVRRWAAGSPAPAGRFREAA